MYVFLLTLLIAVFGFAHSFYILQLNYKDNPNFVGDNYFKALIYAYRAGLGDFVLDDVTEEDALLFWFIFILNTLVIVIVLLNALIAIMGDTFDRVKDSETAQMY